MTRKQLPLLGPIAGLIRWCESLVMLLSGPLLAIGLGIALIDLITNGGLLRAVPELLFAWGVSQAVGVDSQLIIAWDRCHIALRERQWLAVLGFAVLGCLLGYIGFISAEAFGFQHAFGVSEMQALARLGIDAVGWQFQRAALAVGLVALSGFLRYHPPESDVVADTAAERERLEASLQLEPLRQQLRAQQVGGLRQVALSAIGKEVPPRPPTGPGSPTQKPAREVGVITPATNITPLRPPTQAPSRRKRTTSTRVARASVETKARRHYRPGMSASELARVAHIGKSAASKYARLLSAEQTAL